MHIHTRVVKRDEQKIQENIGKCMLRESELDMINIEGRETGMDEGRTDREMLGTECKWDGMENGKEKRGGWEVIKK